MPNRRGRGISDFPALYSWWRPAWFEPFLYRLRSFICASDGLIQWEAVHTVVASDPFVGTGPCPDIIDRCERRGPGASVHHGLSHQLCKISAIHNVSSPYSIITPPLTPRGHSETEAEMAKWEPDHWVKNSPEHSGDTHLSCSIDRSVLDSYNDPYLDWHIACVEPQSAVMEGTSHYH